VFNKIDYSNSFGIQIEDNAIRMSEIKKSGKGLEITGFFKKSLDSGVVERGVVKKIKILAEIIDQSMLNCTPSSIKKRKVICSVPEYKSFVKIVDVPFMREEEAAETIKWEIGDNIPLPLERIYYDWKIVESDQEKGIMKVLLVAASKNVIDSRIKALEKCGLTPIGFIPDSFGLNQCFAVEKKIDNETNKKNNSNQQNEKIKMIDGSQLSAIIYFGDEKSVVFARKGTTILFSSSIFFNASDFIRKIVEMITEGEEKKSQNPKQDEILKKIGDNGFSLKNKEEDYYKKARIIIQELLKEVRDALNYFEKKEEITMPSVYLTGAGASLKGIEELLSEELNTKVEKGKELINYKLENKKLVIPENFICDYSIVLGNALGQLNT
jgi:type IV pilus assembly protein PilM